MSPDAPAPMTAMRFFGGAGAAGLDDDEEEEVGSDGPGDGIVAIADYSV